VVTWLQDANLKGEQAAASVKNGVLTLGAWARCAWLGGQGGGFKWARVWARRCCFVAGPCNPGPLVELGSCWTCALLSPCLAALARAGSASQDRP